MGGGTRTTTAKAARGRPHRILREGSGSEPPYGAEHEDAVDTGGAPSGEHVALAASAPAARRRALAAGAVAMLVVFAVVAGAAIGHELWTASPGLTSAPALPAGGASGGLGPRFGGQPRSGGGFGGVFGPSGGSAGSATAASGAPANVAAIAAKVDPGLVDINSIFGYQSSAGAGTGIVISSGGEVLTNNHVIDGATKITATDIGNGKSYSATVVGYDPSHDVALLKLVGASGLRTSTLGDSSRTTVGEAVVGIGNAGGSGGVPSSAGGSITGLNQSVTAGDEFGGTSEQLSGLIETNAAIQPGDSGGPLVNSAGQVLAMDTAGSQSFFFSGPATQADAIPINQAVTIATAIEAGQRSASVHVGPTAFLGVAIALPNVAGGFGGFNGIGGFNGNGAGRLRRLDERLGRDRRERPRRRARPACRSRGRRRDHLAQRERCRVGLGAAEPARGPSAGRQGHARLDGHLRTGAHRDDRARERTSRLSPPARSRVPRRRNGRWPRW